MNNKIVTGIIGGLVGFLVGVIGGGFLGLVVGGTFFGWVELASYPYMPGYELAAYIGSTLGVFIITPLGVIIALRFIGRKV